jgi:putative ABC transport system ATP-binding protein
MTEKLTAPPVIRLRGIKKNFRVGILDLPVLKGIDLDIYNGEMAAITGTSGGGKSTLMNIIGLLDEPTSGTYAFEGREVVNLDDDELSGIRNEKIGFVFQQFNLLPRLSAAENVAIPLLYRGESIRKSNLIARSFLEKVGMGDRADHNPMELSGGQQQRVAIARALAGNPSIVLADEPTGALDTRVGQEIMDLFLRLNKEDAITIVMITHDPRIAAQCEKRFNICDGLVESRSEAVA